MSPRPKSYVAHIQWNAQENYYAGFIPGIEGTETTAYSREELMVALQRKLSERLKEGVTITGAVEQPKPGYHRVDVTV
jgi:predicted RNase H-like HicB family nuclease